MYKGARNYTKKYTAQISTVTIIFLVLSDRRHKLSNSRRNNTYFINKFHGTPPPWIRDLKFATIWASQMLKMVNYRTFCGTLDFFFVLIESQLYCFLFQHSLVVHSTTKATLASTKHTPVAFRDKTNRTNKGSAEQSLKSAVKKNLNIQTTPTSCFELLKGQDENLQFDLDDLDFHQSKDCYCCSGDPQGKLEILLVDLRLLILTFLNVL